MLPQLSSHRIICACLFLVTSLLVTVVASPLIAMSDQLERQTLTKRTEYQQAIRIGFQIPGSDTYETSFQSSSRAYSGLQLTIFFESTGLRPRIVNSNTPQLQIQTVDTPRYSPAPSKPFGKMDLGRMMNIGPDSGILECHFAVGGEVRKQQAFSIMSDVEKLKAETNKLLQLGRQGLQAGDEFKQVHDIKDDLDYINTCLVFLTLFHNSTGKPMVDAKQLDHWKDIYLQISRGRGIVI
ncbi:hypothetical protein F5050DRAFT_1809718 [Lentinula boryana]|uniref:Uncharacterized protein n=1 Tax=Lentinula boryana TaxID=40481 RepID=A0ABQ8Q755_9AGAR|nr:hypothetical protein F5050DRAFT_1809718 [Lentinula boryana]